MKKRAPPPLLAAAAGLALSLTPLGARGQTFPLYVSSGSQTVQQVSSGGAASPFATLPANSFPRGVAFDAGGNLYTVNAGLNAISRITPAGAVTTFANLPAFSNSVGLAIDVSGNLYTTSESQNINKILQITPGGAVSTYATPAAASVLRGLAFDTSGNLFAAGGTDDVIYKIGPGGAVSTFASQPEGTFPYALTFDHAGNLLVATGVNTILRYTPGGTGTTFASNTLSAPEGLALDQAGNVYAANVGNNTITKFTPAGAGSQFATTAPQPQDLAFRPGTGPKPFRIVSFATPIPGGTGNFTGLPVAPGYSSSGQVAFYGTGAAGQQGIYRAHPVDPIIPPDPVKVADLNTAIPNGTGNFTAFHAGDPIHPGIPSVDGTSVAFFAAGSGGQQGVYVSQNGPLSRVADTATLIPVGTGTFTSFTHPGIPPNPIVNGNNVAFFAAGAGGQQGVYVRDYVAQTAPVRIADMATPIPGGTGNFTAFPSDPHIGGTTVAFLGAGSGGQQGVYRATVGGSPVAVADTHTPIPNGAGNFTSFIPPDPVVPATDGTRVAFFGAGSGGQQGIYVAIPGDPVRPVADTATAIPGGTGLFLSFADVSLSSSDVAFVGTGAAGQQGIYDLTGGALVKVVDLSDVLGGRSITGLGLSATGLAGDPIAFRATFADGSQGVYVATVTPVPEPGTWLLCGLAAVSLGCAGWRRRRGPRPPAAPSA